MAVCEDTTAQNVPGRLGQEQTDGVFGLDHLSLQQRNRGRGRIEQVFCLAHVKTGRYASLQTPLRQAERYLPRCQRAL